MIRLRRYRVSLAIAIFILLGLYYLSDTTGFGDRPSGVFRHTGPNDAISAHEKDGATEKGRGTKSSKDAPFKNSKSNPQVAIPATDEPSSKTKAKGYGYDDTLEFPHKRPLEDTPIDERLVKGRHDPKPTSTTTEKLARFTPVPQNFPVPEDLVIKLPAGKPKAIPRVQHRFARETTQEKRERLKKLKKLKQAFLKHWAGYKEFAWDHDELRPVSGGYQDPFAGWRATLVDTLDMLWIMGLKEEFEEAVEEVGNIDFFTTRKDLLPLFEVAIRYMGGLIAAYDISEARYPVLLDKAKELGEVLMGAFDTPNRMPTTFYRWHNEDRRRARGAASTTVLAEIGSLSMEFIRLAQLTNNDRYYDAVARITDEFDIWQDSTKVPGLWPLNVDASGGCSYAELEHERTQREAAKALSEKQSSATGTSKATGRTLEDMVEANPQMRINPDVSGPDSRKHTTLAADSNEADDQSPDKSLLKRAPPRFRDAGDGKTSTPRKKPPASEDDEDAPETLELNDPYDADSEQADLGNGFESDLDGVKLASKSSFADDTGGEPTRGNSKQLSSPASEDGSQAKPSFEEDDAEDDGDLELEDAGEPNDDEESQQEPSTASKSKGKHAEDRGKFQVSVDDDEADESQITFRHNKPMHSCVKRGLTSSYGEKGLDKFSIGGMADSVYEYLPKSFLLLGGHETQYQRMHEKAMVAVKDYLLFRTMTKDPRRPVYFTGDFQTQGYIDNETELVRGQFFPHTGHLTCFQGAYIALGARIFRNEPDVDLARKLTDGCIWAYEQSPTGIMPELFDMVPCPSLDEPCKFNETAWWHGIDPWAKDKVKVFQQMAAEADREAIAAARVDTESVLTDPLNKPAAKIADLEQDDQGIDPSKAEEKWNEHINRRSVENVDVPSELSHLAEKRRTPAELNAPRPAVTSEVVQPTTLPDYFDQQIKEHSLAPGITKIGAREYILRPEAIESVFYLYRITGDPYYREKGWKMFEAINNATSTKHGNSAISDVTNTEGKANLRDKAESFWTAETLKYFWLLFSNPDVVSLDDWVFNTEAHPFRRPDLAVKREQDAERVRRRKQMGGNMVWDLD